MIEKLIAYNQKFNIDHPISSISDMTLYNILNLYNNSNSISEELILNNPFDNSTNSLMIIIGDQINNEPGLIFPIANYPQHNYNSSIEYINNVNNNYYFQKIENFKTAAEDVILNEIHLEDVFVQNNLAVPEEIVKYEELNLLDSGANFDDETGLDKNEKGKKEESYQIDKVEKSEDKEKK